MQIRSINACGCFSINVILLTQLKAHKVTELYGDDKVKFEFIFHWLNNTKKFIDIHGIHDDDYFKSLSEGNLDGYVVGMIEFHQNKIGLEKAVNNAREFDVSRVPISYFKKVSEICENENVLYLADVDKDTTKKVFKRISQVV